MKTIPEVSEQPIQTAGMNGAVITIPETEAAEAAKLMNIHQA
jgi:hypothetical protein